ncbi:MAG TPA: ferritin [Candidatus Limnocylindrales bacterium]
MISESLAKLLVDQVANELNAHQTYMGISFFFERLSLRGWAKVFRDQATEEAGHAGKIVSFLIDNDVEFDLPAVRRATTRYPAAIDAVQTALDSEVRVTGQFNALATAALAESDQRSHQFCQWFIAEQVEEERTMGALLELVRSGINLFQAEALLDEVAAE